jgi:hypothetical protein
MVEPSDSGDLVLDERNERDDFGRSQRLRRPDSAMAAFSTFNFQSLVAENRHPVRCGSVNGPCIRNFAPTERDKVPVQCCLATQANL